MIFQNLQYKLVGISNTMNFGIFSRCNLLLLNNLLIHADNASISQTRIYVATADHVQIKFL